VWGTGKALVDPGRAKGGPWKRKMCVEDKKKKKNGKAINQETALKKLKKATKVDQKKMASRGMGQNVPGTMGPKSKKNPQQKRSTKKITEKKKQETLSRAKTEERALASNTTGAAKNNKGGKWGE